MHIHKWRAALRGAATFRTRAPDSFARRIDTGLYLDASMIAEIYKANGIQASQSVLLGVASPLVACNYFTCGVAEFSLLFHAVGAGAATGRRARRRNRRGLGCRSCSMRCGHRLRGSRVCPHICFQQLTIVKYFPLSSTFWQDKIYQNLLPRYICSRHSGHKCHSSCQPVAQSQSQ